MLFNKIKKIQFVVLAGALILSAFFCSSSRAAIPFRLGGGLGISGGNYSESFMGSTAKIDLARSFSLQVFYGLQFDWFYVAYAPNGKTRIFSELNNPGASTYLSPLAVEFGWTGLDRTSFPLDVFGGIEYGTFKFSEKYYIGLRAEYKQHFMEIDNHGSLDINTQLSTYYVGIVFLLNESNQTHLGSM